MFPWKNTAGGRRKAVCFYGDRVDVAGVSRQGDRPRIDRLDSYASGGAQLPALKKLHHDLGKSSCATLLSPGEYQLLQVDMPDAGDEDRKGALRWKIRDMVDFPVDEATIDVLDIQFEGAAANRARQCFVVICKNALLAPKILAFQDAGLNLDVVDIPEMAQRNVGALFETEKRGLALLNFNSDGGLITFTYQGELYVARRIEISLQQLEQADEARRNELFDRIALEVQRSVDNFERVFNFITLSRLVAIELPTVPGLLDYLRGYLSLKVAAMDLSEVMVFPDIPELRKPRRQAECLLSIGTALRDGEA